MDIDKFSAHLKRAQAACKLQNKKWSQSIIQVVSSKSSLLVLVFFIKVGFLLIQSFGHMFFFFTSGQKATVLLQNKYLSTKSLQTFLK